MFEGKLHFKWNINYKNTWIITEISRGFKQNKSTWIIYNRKDIKNTLTTDTIKTTRNVHPSKTSDLT
jgi:hypothetical protein